jgi:triacylglycerol lipase
MNSPVTSTGAQIVLRHGTSSRAAAVTSVARKLGWWVEDYAFAAYWQVRALVWRKREGDYLSGELSPVLVIPGIWETWGFMRSLIDPVHAAGHPVYVLPSLRRNNRPVSASAAAIVELVAEKNLRDVLIVAHSKGGLIGKYAMAMLDDTRCFSGMVAVSTPFSGSRYAPYLLLSSLRAFSPRDPTTELLGASLEVNARIVSVYGEFDPHIPEGSELPGARNIVLPTGGHFRVLARPETIATVLEVASATA